MASITTYLTFNGNCAEAFNFYRTVFGGEFLTLMQFKDMPKDPKYLVAESEMEKIMHVTLPIGKGTLLMGSDTGGEWAADFNQGNNFSISIHTDSKEEADRLFNDLSKKGKVIMPMNPTFWGSYFGMLMDPFGIQWMVSFELTVPE